MTKDQFHSLLYDDTVRADERLTAIGDALVTTTITSDDAFWQAPLTEQLLYALCCVMHHAGANGLEALWDYNSATTFAAALEGLREIGETDSYQTAAEFWQRIASYAASAGATVPERFSLGNRAAYQTIDEAIHRTAGWPLKDDRLEWQRLGNSFLSCWDTSLPLSVLIWLRGHEVSLAERICQDEAVA